VIVSEHYAPDPSTTATYITAIANGLTADHEVLVISEPPFRLTRHFGVCSTLRRRDQQLDTGKRCPGAAGDCYGAVLGQDVLCHSQTCHQK